MAAFHTAPAILSLALLAGCASQTPSSPAAPAAVLTMEDAKAALMRARTAWKDPDSIKGTMIGQPYSSGCWGHAEHWVRKVDACVCIATNAKNSFGAYAGLKNQIALLQDRRVLDVIEARSHDQCSNMIPWPEFDARTRS